MKLGSVAIVLLGCYTCLLSTIVYQHRIGFGPVELPWGTILGAGTAYLTALALGRYVATAPALLALGWGIGIIAPIAAPTESFLIAQDGWGWTFLLASAGALALAYVQINRVPK